MPRKRIQFNSEEKNQILKLMKKSKNVKQYKKVQALYLRVFFNYSLEIISNVTGYSKDTVKNIHSKYIKFGYKSLLFKNNGIRRRYNLSIIQEKQLIKQFEKQSKIGGVLDVFKIKKEYEKIIGKEVSESTVYRMLKRHGWRKISPRPSHPKSDQEAMKTFKK